MMNISRVGVDLAKNVFQIHGTDNQGNPTWKRKLSRDKWIAAICKAAPRRSEIGMEACAGAHHWARRLTEHRYQVKLIPPQFVIPYVKSNKNDANVAAVALANKTVRMAWAMMRNNVDYDPEYAVAV